MKYWQLSDKLQASAGSSRVWGHLTRTLNLNPRGLALGLAEGTILFKFTVPIHMPLMLFAIVSLFRRNHWVSAQEQARGNVADMMDARGGLTSASAAARDVDSLVGWGWTWTVE
eukprot:CAMPEP_0181491784 /NCGR_PEP_ID=MMETSP1110-20121109/50328_1 /TAXON_ID=174948 /ORGANISM="Symbiodinium sp., Strain CCMP421" /LENGTH=113 /DNA_ID=CAMNT_0023618963 /DNA_START=1 /DNA_END=342 /DNA_ORIENTATION=+